MTYRTEGKVKIPRFRYVLDWFEVDDVEIDLSVNPKFELQCRGGHLNDWYLIPYKKGDEGFLVPDHYASFNVSKPWVVLPLIADRVLKFSTNNINGFTEQLLRLLEAAKEYENKTGGLDSGSR